MEELLQHYRPGLDVSSLSDEEFITKLAYLLRIRALERDDKVTQTLKNIFGE